MIFSFHQGNSKTFSSSGFAYILEWKHVKSFWFKFWLLPSATSSDSSDDKMSSVEEVSNQHWDEMSRVVCMCAWRKPRVSLKLSFDNKNDVFLSGYFPLQSEHCLVWICLDVLFCTASIMHLCTISIDRYLSLRYPMRFGRNKTRKRVVLKIFFVWLLSIAMSLPLSLMYSKVNCFEPLSLIARL